MDAFIDRRVSFMGSYAQTVPGFGSFAFIFSMRLELIPGNNQEVRGRIAWTRCSGPCETDDYISDSSFRGVEVVEGTVGNDRIIRLHGVALEPEDAQLACDEYEVLVDNDKAITVRSRGIPPMQPWQGATMVGVRVPEDTKYVLEESEE